MGLFDTGRASRRRMTQEQLRLMSEQRNREQQRIAESDDEIARSLSSKKKGRSSLIHTSANGANLGGV